MEPDAFTRCALIPDSLEYDDPWDDLDGAAASYRTIIEALDGLQRVSDQSRLGSCPVKHAPAASVPTHGNITFPPLATMTCFPPAASIRKNKAATDRC